MNLSPDCADRSNFIYPAVAALLVSKVLTSPREVTAGAPTANVRKITFHKIYFAYSPGGRLPSGGHIREDAEMQARFARRTASFIHCRRAAALGLLLVLVAGGTAAAQQGTSEQRRACTPDVYRLCAGEIPNVRAITACLRRQKSNLSVGCAAVFGQ